MIDYKFDTCQTLDKQAVHMNFIKSSSSFSVDKSLVYFQPYKHPTFISLSTKSTGSSILLVEKLFFETFSTICIDWNRN